MLVDGCDGGSSLVTFFCLFLLLGKKDKWMSFAQLWMRAQVSTATYGHSIQFIFSVFSLLLLRHDMHAIKTNYTLPICVCVCVLFYGINEFEQWNVLFKDSFSNILIHCHHRESFELDVDLHNVWRRPTHRIRKIQFSIDEYLIAILLAPSPISICLFSSISSSATVPPPLKVLFVYRCPMSIGVRSPFVSVDVTTLCHCGSEMK